MLVATVQNSFAWDLCTPVLRVVHGWPSGTGAGSPPPCQLLASALFSSVMRGCYKGSLETPVTADRAGHHWRRRGELLPQYIGCRSVAFISGPTFRLLLLVLSLLSPSCAVFTACTWNKPCCLGIRWCSCSVFTVCAACCNVIWHVIYVLYIYISTFRSVCVQCTIWPFLAVPKFRAFPVRCSGTFWVISKWCQSPLLLLVSLLLSHFTFVEFLLLLLLLLLLLSSLTPRSWHPLKKLTVSQQVKKFCATRRFITAFTTADRLSLAWASSIQSTPLPSFLKIHFNTILPSVSRSSKWPLSLSLALFPTNPFVLLFLSPPHIIISVHLRQYLLFVWRNIAFATSLAV